MQVQVIQLFQLFVIVLFAVDYVDASIVMDSKHNWSVSISASHNSIYEIGAVEIDIQTQNESVMTENEEAWFTLDFGEVMPISTIAFISDSSQNVDNFAAMTRTYGTSADRHDRETNKVITQTGGTNFPSMIADINEDGPAQIRYIHWQSDKEFKISEILCFEKKRLHQSQFTNVKSYIQGANSAITSLAGCHVEQAEYTSYHYTTENKISRIVGITDNGSLDAAKLVEFSMKDDQGNSNKCYSHSDRAGFDCHQNAMLHTEMEMTQASDSGIRICSLIFLEDGDEELSRGPLRKLNECASPNPLQWPQFIDYGNSGRSVEVETFDIAASEDIVMAISETDGLGYVKHSVVYYDVVSDARQWTKIIMNAPEMWMNVYFAASDTKVLLVWADTTHNPTEGAWTFVFLEASIGNQDGNFYQQDQFGGKIHHAAIAINQDASSIFVMTNFPDESQRQNVFSRLSFDGSSWSKQLQISFNQNKKTSVNYYQKNAVFLGFDESFVFTMSSSDGTNQDEDCALAIWEANTLNLPTIKKNNQAKMRNCVHPKLLTDSNPSSTDLWVLTVAEYTPNSVNEYTGFIRYQISSTYDNFITNLGVIKYIADTRVEITGVYCPNNYQWYTMALHQNMDKIMMFDWNENYVRSWTLSSHDTTHTFSVIKSAIGINASQLPVTGFYAGGTTSVQSTFGCQHNFSDQVGHISKIELSADSALDEDTPSNPSSSSYMVTESGNGHGLHCVHFLENTSDANYGVDYLVPVISPFETCSFELESWQSNSLTLLSQPYVINSGVHVETFSYKLSSDDCYIQVEIYQMNGSGQYEVHNESILTAVMGTDFGLIQEVDVAYATSDINVDSDGTLPPPVISFKVVIASPTVISAAGEIELFLDVTLEHPCRNAVFTTQVVNDMEGIVHGGPVTQTIPAFAHSLDASQYDCGLQILTFSSGIVTASAQVSSLDNINIYAESFNYADKGILSITSTVSLEDWPQVSLSTSFSVEMTVCEIENPIWSTTSSTSLTETYSIDSNNDEVFEISFEKNMVACQIQVQIQESDGNGGWNVHNGSVLTSSPVISGVTETFDVTISTSDLSLDSGGSVAPTRDYKIVVASPNVLYAQGDSLNPAEFNLALTLEHPCRTAVFTITTQAFESMKALVNHGAVTQDVTRFAHSFDASGYDCGLQQISILPNLFSSFLSESAQLASGDDFVITLDATDPLITGLKSVQIEVSLINFPAISLTTTSFTVNVVACQFDHESWQSNSSSDPNQNVGTQINQEYIIDSGVNMRYLLYEKSDSECTVEIKIYKADENDNWAAYTGSKVTYAMGTDFGQVQTLNVAIATSNLALDSDGTIDSPVFSYKVIVASPSIDEAPGNGQNPIELQLDLTFIHPCRNAVFINQKPDDMAAYINGDQVTQYMAPLAHSMDHYNCGPQEITFPAGQDYTAFMSGSIISNEHPDFRLYAMPTDFNDAGDHFPVATVTMVYFPAVNITTYPFTVTVICCSVTDGTQFSRQNITVSQESKGIIDTKSLYTYESADDTHTIVRQSPDWTLSFVEIDNSEGLPQIVIKPTRDEVPMNYELVLETIYFEEWNDYTLVLQTDTIHITVLSEFFVEEPKLIELDTGQEETWTVEALDTSITIDYTHISLGSASPFVRFDNQTFEFSTIAEEMTEKYVGSHKIELKVKSKNQKSLFIIFVIVGGSGETDELFDSSLSDLVNELEELEQEPYVYPHAGLRPDGDLPPPLQAKLSEIQPSGSIKLKFSRPVKFNTDFLDRQMKMKRSLNASELNATDINATNANETNENTGLFGSLGPEERNKLLAEQFGFRLIHPDAQMEVYPEIQDFYIKEGTPTSFNFQLNISNPDAISSVFREPCTVDFKIEMNALIDPERQGIIELEHVNGLNDIILPHMMDKEQAIQMQNTAQATSGITASLFSFNMLIALAIGMSLKLVWGALNTLQIIVLLAEIDANLSAHAEITLKELKTIALFEFIPYKWFGTQLKMLVTRSRHEAEYEENMVDSMGAMIIIGCVLIAISLLSLILGSLGFWLHNKAYSKVINLIKRKLYWNCFIRYSLQSYLKISFVCFAGLSTLTWDASWFEYARSTAILFACIALAILPLIYGVTLRDKQALSQNKVKRKIGSLNQGIRNFRHMQALYSVFFLLRRMIFVIVLLKLKDYPSLVVSSTIILNFFNIMYLGIIEPHSSMFYQIIELFNETFLQLIICFFAISMMSPGIDFGKSLGWALISFIVTLIMVNLVCIIGKTLIEGKWYVHIYKLKKALDKRKKAKKEQKLRRALERIYPQGQTVETARAFMGADNPFYSEESEAPKQKPRKVLEEISEVASQAEISRHYSRHYLPFQYDPTAGQLNILPGMVSQDGETMQHSYDDHEQISVEREPRIVPFTRPSKNVDDLVIPNMQSKYILPSDSQWRSKEEVKVADIRELLSAGSSKTGRTGRSGKVSPAPLPYYVTDNLMHSRSDVTQAQAFKQRGAKFNNSGKNLSKQLTKDPVMMQKQIYGNSAMQVDNVHPSSREADFLNSSDGFSDLCQANRMNFVAGLKDFHQSGFASPKNVMQHQFLEQETNSHFIISLNKCNSVKFEQSQQDIEPNQVHQNSEILEADDRTEDSVIHAYQKSAESIKETEPQEMRYQKRQVDPSKQVGIMRYLTQVENSKNQVKTKQKKCAEAKKRKQTGKMPDAYEVQYEKRKTEKKKTSKFDQDAYEKPAVLTK